VQPSRPRTLHVLHVLGTAALEGSGIARIVGDIAAELDPSVYRVHACFLGEFGPLVEQLESAGAIAQHVSWARGVQDPVGAWRFWRYLRKHDFAIVHQHFGARSVRRLIKAASQARLLVHLHGRIDETASVGSVPIAAWGADALIAVSRSVALQVEHLHPILVYSGISIPGDEACIRQSAPEAVVLGTACRLVPLKGLSYLLLAVAELRPEFPNLRLEIAGRGPLQGELEREANRLGLTGHVGFLGWQREIGPVLRSWDIFVMPSLDEGLPMAVLNAMAEGLPVVATSVGGLPELVEDGRTGYLVPPRDSLALARRLRRLLLEPERRSALGAAGRERVRNRFSAGQMVAQIRAIYDTLSKCSAEHKEKNRNLNCIG
jgi:glycosyltransferase involved in cell wall biosynthesis